MLNGKVALYAFDFMIADVGFVKEIGFAQSGETLIFPVTVEALFPGHHAIARHHLRVALMAVHILFHSERMVEPQLFFSRGVDHTVSGVTKLTSTQIFKMVIILLEMADEARAFCHHDMVSLDHLRVTARTAEFLPSPKFGQMRRMGKVNALKLFLPIQKLGIMAAGSQTTLIRNLRPGLGFAVGIAHIFDHLDQPFHFASQFMLQSGRVVTIDTGDFGMGGRLPSLIKWNHVMTSFTKRRPRRILDRARAEEQENKASDSYPKEPFFHFFIELNFHSTLIYIA